MNLEPKVSQRLYHDLAWLWPVISPPEEYIKEALLFASLARKYCTQPPKTILHLGCGGGHIDRTLKKYLQITGVDISKAMLDLAHRLNPEVTYLEGDMRNLRLEKRFDAVMVADSIDYMLSEDDLHAVFQTAFLHLKPGGVFLTYIEAWKEGFENNRTDTSSHTQGDLEVTLVENLYDPNPADTTYEMTFIYLIRQAGRLTLELDQHLGGIFPLETWPRLLEEAGFQMKQENYEGEELPFFIGLHP